MAQNRVLPPKLDERTWQQLVEQARALIPIYAPEWTDHGPNDLGATLIELFAWYAEGLTQRLNRTPEKNFIEFLNLLGITRDPPTPASTYLTFRLAPGSPSIVVPRGSQFATEQTETKEAIVFETEEDVRILSANLTTALRSEHIGVRSPYYDVTPELIGAPLSSLSFSIRAMQTAILWLGFDAPSLEEIRLYVRFSKPPVGGLDDIALEWRYSKENLQPTNWPLLDPSAIGDGTSGFRRDGMINVYIPSDWSSQRPQDWTTLYSRDSPSLDIRQSRFWLGVSITNESVTESKDLVLTHVFHNSVRATTALTIAEVDMLGSSNGRPFQVFELSHQPVFKQTSLTNPYDHLTIGVREPQVGGPDEFGEWEAWTRVEEFSAGGGKEYRLDPVTGTITLGNHDPETNTGRGRIPPRNSQIRAKSYRYVAGGANGNVAPGAISVVRRAPPEVIGVTNPGPATGGSDEEPIEETKRRGPELLRNRYRAVTVEDYEYLAREATTDVRKVRCLPPRLLTYAEATSDDTVSAGDPWEYAGLDRSPNNVNVIIVPDAPSSQPMPTPSDELLQEVSDYLEARKVVTSFVNVTGPSYLPIKITTRITLWPAAAAREDEIKDEIRSKISAYLHPLTGGPDSTGWEVGQSFSIAGLLQHIQPAPELGYVSSISAAADAGAADRPSFLHSTDHYIQVADYELICSVKDKDHIVD